MFKGIQNFYNAAHGSGLNCIGSIAMTGMFIATWPWAILAEWATPPSKDFGKFRDKNGR